MKKINKRTKEAIKRKLEFTREKNKGQKKEKIQKNWAQYRRYKFDKIYRKDKEKDLQLYTERRNDFIEFGSSAVKSRGVSKNYIEKSYRLNKSNYKEKFIDLTDKNFNDTRLLVIKYKAFFRGNDTDGLTKKVMLYSKVVNSKTVGFFTEYDNLINEITEALEANIEGRYELGEALDYIEIIWIRYKIYNQRNAAANKTKGAK